MLSCLCLTLLGQSNQGCPREWQSATISRWENDGVASCLSCNRCMGHDCRYEATSWRWLAVGEFCCMTVVDRGMPYKRIYGSTVLSVTGFLLRCSQSQLQDMIHSGHCAFFRAAVDGNSMHIVSYPSPPFPPYPPSFLSSIDCVASSAQVRNDGSDPCGPFFPSSGAHHR